MIKPAYTISLTSTIWLLLLSSCTAMPPKVTEVKIPVPIVIKCKLEKVAKPELISDAELVKLPDGAYVWALHRDRLQRKGYEAELEAVINGCK
jgi:hypothetical protein